jgi:hypothetical protein
MKIIEESINDQINKLINIELKNDTISSPFDKGYVSLKYHIIKKINKIIKN